jgi:hypothetical protein
MYRRQKKCSYCRKVLAENTFISCEKCKKNDYSIDYCDEKCLKHGYYAGHHSFSCPGVEIPQIKVDQLEDEIIQTNYELPFDANVEAIDIKHGLGLSHQMKSKETRCTAISTYSINIQVPVPKIPERYSLGILCGRNEIEKNILLKRLATEKVTFHRWDNTKSICSHFRTPGSAESALLDMQIDANEWIKPYSILSPENKLRADLAMLFHIKYDLSHKYIDIFDGMIDPVSFKSIFQRTCTIILSRYIYGLVITVADPDVNTYTNPDWVYFYDKKYLYSRKESSSSEVTASKKSRSPSSIATTATATTTTITTDTTSSFDKQNKRETSIKRKHSPETEIKTKKEEERGLKKKKEKKSEKKTKESDKIEEKEEKSQQQTYTLPFTPSPISLSDTEEVPIFYDAKYRARPPPGKKI